MARVCALTGKKVQFGHNVSHSKRATNRRFEPNIQKVRLQSEALGQRISLNIATRTLRTVQKKGGLDGFLLNTDDSKLQPGDPTGYSAAGVVLEVGAGIDDLAPGDRVACAGAQCAFHAGVIRVPRNLVVPVPDGVDLEAASSVALGAIALQGVRRLQPTLGETFVVLVPSCLPKRAPDRPWSSRCRVSG